MNVACPGCGTRYAVADEKVRGRRVRIACKHCSAPIIVDGTVPPPEVEPIVAPIPTDAGSTREAPVAAPPPPAPTTLKASVAPPAPTTLKASVAPPAPTLPKAPIPPIKVPQPMARVATQQIAVRTPAALRPSDNAQKAARPLPSEAVATAPYGAKLSPVEPKPTAAVPPQGIPRPRSMTPLAVPTVQRPASQAPAGTPVPIAPPVGQPFARAVRPARAMHATIIGVAAPANPPPPAVAPPPPIEEPVKAPASSPSPAAELPQELVKPRTSVMPGIRRNPKKTMIGGLEAAAGNAPSPQAIGLGIPTETKWTVLLANTGAEVMSAADIVRAFAEGKIDREAKLWREGLDGWKTLIDIEPIRLAFQRAGLSLEAPEAARASSQRPPAPTQSSPTELAPNAPRREAMPAARPAAPTERKELSWDDEAETVSKREDATCIAPSPFAVPDAGATEAARLASTAGLPPRQDGTPQFAPSKPDDEPLEHPASRPDIGPRDTVRGELHGVPTVPPAGPLLGPEAIEALSDTTQSTTTVRPKIRRRPKRRALTWLLWLLVVVGFCTALTLSYKNRQPPVFYNYLQKKHWAIPIDKQVQRFVARPYRNVAKKVDPYLRKLKKR